ncbi:MAG: hypothetical protein JEZ12_04940 [Desulfobacterium sp.]|nr:hypothetical protein [Desulfobacterium sp.]
MKALISCLLMVSCIVSVAWGDYVTWNFDDIPVEEGYIHFLPEPGYRSDNFTITGFHKLPPYGSHFFSYRGTSSSAYMGQEIGTSTSYVDTITRDDGGTFDLVSLDLRGGIKSAAGYDDINLIFTLAYGDGTTITTSAAKNVAWSSLETFSDPMWKNLVSFTIDNDEYYSIYSAMGMAISRVVFDTTEPLFFGDFDKDNDVDGYDLATLVSNLSIGELQEFAENFGS